MHYGADDMALWMKHTSISSDLTPGNDIAVSCLDLGLDFLPNLCTLMKPSPLLPTGLHVQGECCRCRSGHSGLFHQTSIELCHPSRWCAIVIPIHVWLTAG